MIYIYTALFEPKENGKGFYAKVPDIPGCVTSGKDLSDAIEQITDALNGGLVVAEDEGLDIPSPSSQNSMNIPAGASCSFIKADTLAYRARIDNKTVRKNVSLPLWMIKLADKYNINCSQLLQESLKNMFEKLSKTAM
ncbi:type II toxin-antitoxin system HicB family antitoxin [Anaerovibrio sp.]|uniref:type II toxin-antitoxin system HicB family antitoxin n=1 Tax=Anaerovibrio sp. TaxID=1872532 RepID=UPI0025BEA8A2|nr:type II toxin-antitoxin system HicB family antitoxin [Anaerovibrio sp.]MBR2143004.1 type II toxin-antitoxin system HicB family antitoxin [Anaerovibrio sp.]